MRKTHAQNLIEHLKRAPNQTLRRRELIAIYRAHSEGTKTYESTIETAIDSVAQRVGQGVYRLKDGL